MLVCSATRNLTQISAGPILKVVIASRTHAWHHEGQFYPSACRNYWQERRVQSTVTSQCQSTSTVSSILRTWLSPIQDAGHTYCGLILSLMEVFRSSFRSRPFPRCHAVTVNVRKVERTYFTILSVRFRYELSYPTARVNWTVAASRGPN